jgi:polyisoprenoid-binding protein YceI
MKFLAAFAVLSTLAAGPQSLRAIDPSHSRAAFSVAHIWVQHVTGSVPIVSGTVVLAPGSNIPTSAQAVLDATRIDTGEPDRDRSLESADFFDAQHYPHWTFTSTRVLPQNAGTFEMNGDLTIHGVTQPERLKVTIAGSDASPTYHATAQLDRHAFGMATTRLDPAIGNTIDVTLDIALK